MKVIDKDRFKKMIEETRRIWYAGGDVYIKKTEILNFIDQCSIDTKSYDQINASQTEKPEVKNGRK